MKSEIKKCQNCKQDFTIEPEDFLFYEKIKVPPPTFCPECRNERRMCFRNERSLYKIKCLAPEHSEQIISMYSSDEPFSIVDNKFWWSDNWDPISYAIDYNFSKSFFEQFHVLLKKVPMSALSTMNSIKSDYTNFVDGNKNCYLIFGSGWNENTNYGNKLFSCKDSCDLLMCTKCDLSYECEGCTESDRIFYCRDSKNCMDSYFLYSCRNCNNCFGCSNLIGKSYCIWNEQLTKEEYFKHLSILRNGSFSSFLKNKTFFWNNVYLKNVHRYANIYSSTNCVGDNILNSKNSKKCFDIYENSEDSKHQYGSLHIKDCYDGIGIFKNEFSYEGVDCNYGNSNLSTIVVYNSNNIKYSMNCHNCSYCFACVGLKNKQYCILNKQYTKEEYEQMIPKIIQHMNDMPSTVKEEYINTENSSHQN